MLMHQLPYLNLKEYLKYEREKAYEIMENRIDKCYHKIISLFENLLFSTNNIINERSSPNKTHKQY
jgi:hypothetical protein